MILIFIIVSQSVIAQNASELSNEELFNLSLEELMELDVVSTSKFSSENTAEAPSVISVITEDQIKKSGAKDMEEVLRTVAGFDLIKKGTASNTMVGVRGLFSTEGTNNKILFLINGHPYRSALFNDSDVAIGNYPIKNISKIEVIRGPGSTLFGAGAFLAVINVITKDTEELVEVQASAGSFNTFEGYGLLSIKGEKANLKISGDYYTTDGPSILLESDIASEVISPLSASMGYANNPSAVPGYLNYNRQTLNLSLEANLNNFYLLAGRMDSRNEPTIGIYEALSRDNAVKNIGTFTEIGYKIPLRDKGELLIKSYYDLYQHDNNTESWSYETTDFFNYINALQYQMMQLPSGPTFYKSNEGQYYRTTSDNTNIGGEINFAYNIKNQFKILAGATIETQLLNNISTYANGNIFIDSTIVIGNKFYLPFEAFGETRDISESFNWLIDPTPTGEVDIERNIQAIFGQTEMNFTEMFDMVGVDNFALVLGGRYDHYSDFGGSFNPRAVVILEPNEKWYMKALYGEAFRAPSFAELYIHNQFNIHGNTELKPEKVFTAEAVVGFKPFKGTEFTLSYFNTRINDNIMQIYHHHHDEGGDEEHEDGDNPTEALDREYANAGNFKSSGLELDFRSQVNDKMSLSGSITYQNVLNISRSETIGENTEGADLHYQQDDFAPGGIPKYIINLMGNYKIAPFININLSINHLGERLRSEEMDFQRDPVTGLTNGNVVKVDDRNPIPSRTLLNTSLLFHNLPKVTNIEIQFTGYNLFNAQNYNPTTTIRGSDIQREGINFLGTLRYRF